MAQIKFKRTTTPTGEIIFIDGPDYGSGSSIHFSQPIDISDGGDVYSYDKGIKEEIFRLKWELMSNSDYDAMQVFLLTVANGRQNDFVYYDENALAHTVLFWADEISFPKAKYGYRGPGEIVLRKAL